MLVVLNIQKAKPMTSTVFLKTSTHDTFRRIYLGNMTKSWLHGFRQLPFQTPNKSLWKMLLVKKS